MSHAMPDIYRFHPRTFVLPQQFQDLKSEMLQIGDKIERTYIVKPDRGSQGRGIILIQEPDEVQNAFSSDGNGAVAQKYIKPFLIDGKKFDLRIYVLLTSLNPLHVYIFKEGMARFCTETYKDPKPDNLDHYYSHLTNYSLNKTNTSAIRKLTQVKSTVKKPKSNDSDQLDQIDLYETPLKRSLTSVMNSIKKAGKDVDQLQEEIDNMIRFTIASVQPFLSSSYHSVIAVSDGKCRCFEILGFDVLIDHELRPWLLEVNCMPSLTTDSEFDRILKHSVIKGALKIVDIKPDFRHLLKERQKELSQGKKKILFSDSENEFRIAREETHWRQLLPFPEIDDNISLTNAQLTTQQINSSNSQNNSSNQIQLTSNPLNSSNNPSNTPNNPTNPSNIQNNLTIPSNNQNNPSNPSNIQNNLTILSNNQNNPTNLSNMQNNLTIPSNNQNNPSNLSNIQNNEIDTSNVNNSMTNEINEANVINNDANEELLKRKKKLNRLKFNYEKALRVSRDSPLGAAAQTTASKAKRKATEMEINERKRRLSDMPQIRRSVIVTQSLPPLKDIQNCNVKKSNSKSTMPSTINKKLGSDMPNKGNRKSLSNFPEQIKTDRSMKSIQIRTKLNDDMPLYMHFYDAPRNHFNALEEEQRKMTLKKRYQEEIQLGIVDSVFSYYKMPKKNDHTSAQAKFSVKISKPLDSFKPPISYNLL